MSGGFCDLTNFSICKDIYLLEIHVKQYVCKRCVQNELFNFEKFTQILFDNKGVPRLVRQAKQQLFYVYSLGLGGFYLITMLHEFLYDLNMNTKLSKIKIVQITRTLWHYKNGTISFSITKPYTEGSIFKQEQKIKTKILF